MQDPNSGGPGPSLATCPACGRESHAQGERSDPQLIIVADDREHLYELFQRAFAYSDTVHVLVDRRVTERRRRSGPSMADRRRADRRSPTTIDGLLRSTGWAAVPPGCPGALASFCPLVLSRAAPGASLLEVVGPPSAADARPFVGRQLLGVGVLLLTMVPGYVASRTTGAQATPHATHASADLQAELESAASRLDIDSLIGAVATRYGVSVDLIAAIIEAESEFNPRAVSRTGARGLMQLMPETAAILGVGDPFDPRENIDAGVRHLRSLMDRFDGNLPLVLAAYNAGERAVIGHRGVPPYRETRQYVNRILRRLDRPNAKTSDAGRHERKA
jgi:Transglycosylase SLT domain